MASVGARWVEVGRAFTTTKTSASMTDTTGSSSTLGVGVSTDKGGSFSVKGSTSVGSTATIEMTKLVGYATRAWRTQFFYSKFAFTCAGPGYYTTIQVKATSFVGGAGNAKRNRPAAKYCTTQTKGSSFIKDQSRSSTFPPAPP